MKDKRGLSEVITTLIILLLSIVAIGIVWAIVSGILQSNQTQITSGTACLQISVTATNVVDNTLTGSSYNITLTRASVAGGLGGVKLVLFNSSTNSGVTEFGDTINPLETKTRTVAFSTPVVNATSIQVTPYLNGTSTLCSTTTFTFIS